MTSLSVLPLLQDGSCSIQGECLGNPGSVHARCPQIIKCGTCVAWTPREENRYTRNSGQCMLDRTATQYLDCNAAICPYYRPRVDSAAYAEWTKHGAEKPRKLVTSKTRSMGREAPPPTREALAQAAFRDHGASVGEAGAFALEGFLASAEPLPVLLERFRGGTVRVGAREAPLEALWARLVLVRRAMALLEDAVDRGGLDAETREKVKKDLAGIGGSMTTFNILFKDKDETFKGSAKD